MSKRAPEGALSPGTPRGAPESASLPSKGHFELLQDARSPLLWQLRLGDEEAAATFAFSHGLPLRPGDARVAAHVGDALASPDARDRGSYTAERTGGDGWTVRLDGRKVRGRYLLHHDGGVWTVQRLDEPSVKPFPDRLLPMLATAGPYPDDDTSYAYEVKWDGIRALAYVRKGRVVVRSRNLHDITSQYPELHDLDEILGGREAVLDGEIVAFDERGMPSFQKLQGRLGITSSATVRKKRNEIPIIYMVFDILYLDGEDTTQLPYESRRGLLESLGLSGPHVQVSPSFRGQGKVLLSTPGLEGIVAKRLGSTYEPGARSRAWLKVKTQSRQEFVIGGWTPGRGARAGRIGSLLVGVYDRRSGDGPQSLLYAGNVGTGFTDQILDDLQRLLSPFIIDKSPFAGRVPKKDATFVQPRFACEVEFTEWTGDGRLRHPSFKGLRDDKDPRDIVREENGHHA